MSLTAAVAPLREAGHALHGVADRRRELLALVDGPVGEALERFLRAWELAAFAAAEDALAVAASLEYAASRYARTDAAVMPDDGR